MKILLNNKLHTIRFPKGSMVVFTSNMTLEKEGDIFDCAWYDKVGVERTLINVVDNPPEWQNMTEEETLKICEMFDMSYMC